MISTIHVQKLLSPENKPLSNISRMSKNVKSTQQKNVHLLEAQIDANFAQCEEE